MQYGVDHFVDDDFLSLTKASVTMNRSAFRRFEFFDVDTISEDMTTILVSFIK
jgi:hypothetical protein